MNPEEEAIISGIPPEREECDECGGDGEHDEDCPLQFDADDPADFSGADDIPGFANDR